MVPIQNTTPFLRVLVCATREFLNIGFIFSFFFFVEFSKGNFVQMLASLTGLTKLSKKSFRITANSAFLQRNYKRFFNELIAEKAIIFRNGNGLFTSEIILPKKKTHMEVKIPPQAVFGTVWISSDSEKIGISKLILNICDISELSNPPKLDI
jgi:hypothetical protein